MSDTETLAIVRDIHERSLQIAARAALRMAAEMPEEVSGREALLAFAEVMRRSAEVRSTLQ